jgi:type IV fimbrial biogenesis protein FimT
MPVDSCKSSSPTPPRRQAGFGLVELIITIVIVAVLAALALPSYQNTIKNNRTVTEANDLLTALDTARTEAVTRSRFVSVCPSNPTATGCSADASWGTGWIVFADDYVGTGTFNAGTDSVLRAWPPSSGLSNAQDTIGATLGAGGAAISWISFDRQGSPRTNAGYPASDNQVTFVVRPASCPTGTLLVRTLTLATIGRTTVATSPCP